MLFIDFPWRHGRTRSRRQHIAWLLAGMLFLASAAQAQERLSDDLPQLLKASLQGNPSLRAAWLEVEASGLDVTVAERARWPVVSAVVESRTGNDSNAPSRSMRIEQTLWDAQRRRLQITLAEAQKQIAFYRYGEQQQQVFLGIVAAWQTMVSAAAKIAVADRALDRLKQYQVQMERRVAAEASPRIDLELVNARYNQTAVERSTSQTALNNALSRLQHLTGLTRTPGNATARMPQLPDTTSWPGTAVSEEDINAWVQQHPTVRRTQTEVEQAQARYDSKNAERWPEIYMRVEQPVGKSVSYTDTRMSTFLGMRYTPGAGFSNLVEAKALSTRALSAQESSAAAVREVREAFENDRDEIQSERVRTQALTRAVDGSVQVLESYQRQFQGGRKSWLDLLNAARELAQNEYALADASTGLVAAEYKYLVRAQLPLENTP